MSGPYIQNYLLYVVVFGIILKLWKPSLMVDFRMEHPFGVLSHTYFCLIHISEVYLEKQIKNIVCHTVIESINPRNAKLNPPEITYFLQFTKFDMRKIYAKSNYISNENISKL